MAIAFWTSSKPARPLMTRQASAGDCPASTRAPVTLSTALCRRTSSRVPSGSPAAVNSPAACTPPVRAKTDWPSRSRSGSRRTTAADGSSPAQEEPRGIAIADSMLSLPHTPQADDPVDSEACRWAGSAAGGAASVTVTTLNSCSGDRSASVQ